MVKIIYAVMLGPQTYHSFSRAGLVLWADGAYHERMALQAELRRAQTAASELLKEAQVKKQIAERKLKWVSAHLVY